MEAINQWAEHVRALNKTFFDFKVMIVAGSGEHQTQ